MHVAIDYTPALRQSAGIGRYTRGLVAALAELDREHAYTLLSYGAALDASAWPANFAVRNIRLSEPVMSRLWQRLRIPLPAEWLAGACDLYHSPDFTLPPLSRARGLVTVHDLSFLTTPECAPPTLRDYLQRVVPQSIGRAASRTGGLIEYA